MSQKEYYHVEAERELNNYIEKLIKIKTNFSKNPYRKFLHNTLIKKKTDVRAIRVAVLETLQKHETILEFTKFNFLVKPSRALVDEINAIIDLKLQSAKKVPTLKNIAQSIIFCKRLTKLKDTNMASVIEIIKIITALVPTYDGNGEKLASIVAALNACKSLINEANKEVAINTILSRFEGKARSAIDNTPNDVDEIAQKSNDKCKGTIAPETVVAKMNAIKQNGETSKFTQEIERLTMKLFI